MKAILLQNYGGLSALKIDEVPTPVPAAGEVLVKVKAFTISPLELKIRKGEAKMFVRRKLPMLMGVDFAGEVVAVGDAVQAFKVTDKVMGAIDPFKQSGPYAEYVVAKTDQLIPKPAELSFETASALPIAGASALSCLRDLGKLKSGQRVMILGAAGALGHLAVQLAKQMGASVTGVCRASNFEFVKGLGADEVIDYTVQNPFEETEAYDLIIDIVDRYTFKEARQALKKGGVFVNSVPGPAKFLQVALNPFRSKTMALLMLKLTTSDLAWVTNQVKEGKLRLHLDKIYSGLESIYEATTNVEAGHVRGKLVIKVG